LRRREPKLLAQSIEDARKEGYVLGVKLVRGAYHVYERKEHETNGPLNISSDPAPPVWPTKADTDACYDSCAKTILETIADDQQAKRASVGVMFGTHNWDSTRLVLDELVDRKLATRDEQGRVVVGNEIVEKVSFGQLYGMGYALEDYVVGKTVSNTPMLIKYVPYGALSEVSTMLCCLV
jgi:proline dehydrogenase